MKLIVAALVVVALMFVMPILGVLFGAFAGWVVGWFWTDTILDFLRRFGVETDGLAVWQVGAALGFLGSFFKATLSTSKSD